MRVLIVTPTFGSFGGLETYVFALGDMAAAHPELEPVVCLKRTAPYQLRPEMHRAMLQSHARVATVGKASSELWEEIRAADLVHAQNFSADVGVMTRLAGRPLLVTVHGHRPVRPPVRVLLGERASRHSVGRWYNSQYTWDTWEPEVKRDRSRRVSLRVPQSVALVPPEARRGFVSAARWIPNKGLETLLE